jgi:hypothetical protein
VSPLYNVIGPLGFGAHADAVLDGTSVAPPATDPYAVKLLYQTERPSGRSSTAYASGIATG